MKIKKIKLLKALALTSSLGIVATVPIIVSSCSTSSNNGSSDNNNDSDSSNTKVTPEFQSSVTLIGSIANIYDGTSSTSSLLEKDLQKNSSKLLINSDKLGNDFKITVDGDLSNSKWGTKDYDTWKGQATNEVYYQITLDQFNITSPDDLYDQLSTGETLSNIFKSILGESNTTNKTYSLTTDTKWGIEGDLLHVSVTETTSSQKDASATKTYDLAIPVSDINLNINCSVTVSGSNVVETKKDLTIKYDVGINDKSTYAGPTDVQEITEKVNVDSILVKLGLAKTKDSSKISITTRSLSSSTRSEGGASASTVELDNQKIGETLGVFNTEFSGQTLTEDTSSAKATDDNTTTYTLSLQGKPIEGHTWEDGTSDAQSFAFKVKIKKIATFEKTKLIIPSGTTITWAKSGFPNPNTSNEYVLEAKLTAFVSDKTDTNIKAFLDKITNSFVQQGGLINAHAILLKDGDNGYLRYINSKWQVRIGAEPNDGYSAGKDMNFSSVKSWIDITINNS